MEDGRADTTVLPTLFNVHTMQNVQVGMKQSKHRLYHGVPSCTGDTIHHAIISL